MCSFIVLGTVLANEEVIDGCSERGQYPVVQRPIRQWILKITKYADKLNKDLVSLDWPEGTLSAQKKWIGRSDGVIIKYSLVFINNGSIDKTISSNSEHIVEVFTSRPETIMGVTFLVLAPEHLLVNKLNECLGDQSDHIIEYIDSVRNATELQRSQNLKAKSGVRLGSRDGSCSWWAKHPISEVLIPVFLSDYVIASYGTGAVMGVPAHDERDYYFSKAFDLKVLHVLCTPGKSPEPSETEFTGSYNLETDVLCNSGSYDGPVHTARDKIINDLIVSNNGYKHVIYKLRDWIFSRQRYWGEPIPIYYPVDLHANENIAPIASKPAGMDIQSYYHSVLDPKSYPHTVLYEQPIAVDESELPLSLPNMFSFHPQLDQIDEIEGCLGRNKEWKYFKKEGKWYARETNTMPQVSISELICI